MQLVGESNSGSKQMIVGLEIVAAGIRWAVDQNELLREHVRQKRGWYRIKPEDHPKRTPLRTSQLLWRAGRAGAHIGALCEAMHRQQGEVGVRRILGVLSLAKKYGAAAVDEACAAALDMGVQEYRFVRRLVCSKSIP
jgi:hypothetical protein